MSINQMKEGNEGAFPGVGMSVCRVVLERPTAIFNTDI
jgi:hypothetical protein